MNRIGWHTALALCLALALATPPTTGPAPTAHAASTFTVNSTADEPDANPGNGACASTPSGACTVRAAIMEANALAGPDTIMLPSGTYALSRAPVGQTDTAADGDLDISSEVTIRGASARTTLVTLDDRAFPIFGIRLLEISSAGLADISGISFRGGRPDSGTGGAISNEGRLTLRDSEIRNSRTRSNGGGLHNASTALLENVLVTGNVVTGSAQFGGGILNTGSSLTLRNVTVSANTAGTSGGGLYNTGTAALVNVTMQGNEATTGKSIANSGRVGIRNSVIARTGGDNCSGNALESLGNNVESGTSCRLMGPADQSSTDPLLGPLTDNSGPTDTHALLTGSPAIDAGADAICPVTDQRGAPRPRDGNGDGTASCDIGAFEVQTSPTAVVCSPRPPIRVAVGRNGPGALLATITASPPGVSGGAQDRLRTLRTGRVTNATVDAGGQTGLGSNQAVTLPDGTSQTSMVVHRGPNGSSATVELVVVDDCGEWRTFVGGGPGAF